MMRVRAWRTALLSLAPTLAATALAQHVEIGDAGGLPGTAQAVSGESVIRGTITDRGDADVFRITITSAVEFSATVTGFGDTPLEDSQLFLFDLAGFGIAHNDDASAINLHSAMPMGHVLYSSLAPGEYLIGLSSYDNDAKCGPGTNTADYIFANIVAQGEVVGPQTALSLSGWDGLTFGIWSGGYEIQMTGVSTVPEPATLMALGLGAVAVLRKRRSA